jgi:calmodulin
LGEYERVGAGSLQRRSISFAKQEPITMMTRNLFCANSEECIPKAFESLDVNGDSFISPAELRHVMTSTGENLTDGEVDEMIREADLEGDGRMDCMPRPLLRW